MNKFIRSAIVIFCSSLIGCNEETILGNTDGLPPIVDCSRHEHGWNKLVRCAWEGMPKKIPVHYSSGQVLMEDSLIVIECHSGSNQCSDSNSGQIVGRFDTKAEWIPSGNSFNAIVPPGYIFNQTASGRYVAYHANAFASAEDASKWLTDDEIEPSWIKEDRQLAAQARFEAEAAEIKRKQNKIAYQAARAQGVPTGVPEFLNCEVNYSEIRCPENINISDTEYPILNEDGTSRMTIDTTIYTCDTATKRCKYHATAGDDPFIYYTTPDVFEGEYFGIKCPSSYRVRQTRSGKFIAIQERKFPNDEAMQAWVDSN
ncbi:MULTISPECIES: hypothetical protein [unclassified Pseudomonas]|uniref:hypothetical protein n=1 Tax=unclassified Pseudomonas TaxID=196821 RepID=UPI002446D236|nr:MULTISPECIES: hypothetical protein [unclassified Pseudomonas]MDH0897567.1 hypothetical protein [Pseudomonas sp. GD03875]MDH1067597.1 hypothetical protein [Pseudomonas sp. GD03985]